MEPLEIENTKEKSVACCGKDAPYDHPKVYLEINPRTKDIDCPYCGKRFVLSQ